jgi:hypothetical protein
VTIRAERLALVAAFVGLGVVLFAAAMTAPLDYDEELYVTGAYFARSLSVYRDFVSVQPPLYTWVLGAAMDVVGDWYLLTARVVIWVCGFGVCALLYSLLAGSGTGRLVALALVVGFVTSPSAEGPLVEARNDILPLFCLLAALRLCLRPDGEFSRSVPRLMLSGLFAAAAGSMKYTYLFAAPMLAAVLFCEERFRGEASRPFAVPRTGALLAGAVIGAFPLIYALAVYRDRFVLETLRFHLTVVFDWYQAHGYGGMLSLEHKIKSLPRQMILRGNASIAIIGALSVLALVLGRAGDAWRALRREPRTIALIASLCGALVLAILAGPHAMYMAPVAALGALLAGRIYAAAQPRMPAWLTATMLVASLLPATPAYQRYGRWLARSADLGQWTGIQTHRSAVRIAQMLAQQGVSGHVATLFPTVVIDANRVLPEFAAGPFFFRSADAYPAEQVAQLRGVGPATLDSLFAVSPPAAIVAGFGPFRFKWNPPMDAALIDYARRSGFVRVAGDWAVNGYRNGQVWVRRPRQGAMH